MAQLGFYFDFVSPYSYLAQTQIRKLNIDADYTIDYQPVLLGVLHESQGIKSPAFVPAKAQWIFRDCHLWANHYGVPLQWNSQFPFNTLFLLRVVLWMKENHADKVADFIHGTFDALWQQGLNPKDENAIRSHIESYGVDVDAVQAGTQEPHIKQALKDQLNVAKKLGMFGLPAFTVGEEVFFGQDRLMFVENALEKQAS
ncbi:2-hydroxychromene-2-carboxylate isomerase [Bermanella marisrubri]|uniref:2-hydroxychromene-2-carboxylate isomerase n=1 Tax=Bermanella marisrubri TaxID=207949 RepID=Q1N2R4_9GAMM|nr:2-hydroxychromene-2-carboxylate isomerase [Bermanella marisrubri]EAT12605.1 DSBA oxidoreductase [Oceanobacter sp. RED65] [Bermanella marisrubri]QIZ84842.1 2-hydroxychromene-2-carboxylate isomerase [Bermanella marisrubri]